MDRMQTGLSQKLIEFGLSEEESSQLAVKIQSYRLETQEQVWEKIVKEILVPSSYPFSLHRFLYQFIYPDWNICPRPAWFPEKQRIETSNLSKLMEAKQFKNYTELQQWSSQHRADFWETMIKILDIQFDKPYTRVLDISRGVEYPQWLIGASLNIINSCFKPECANELAIRVQGDSGKIVDITYDELDRQSNRVANGILRYFKQGDRLAIIMPMNFEVVQIYLGIIKAGCVCVSIADSFSASEIKTRLRIANVKGVFTQSHILRERKNFPLYDKIKKANAPLTVVIATQVNDMLLRGSDCLWDTFLDSNQTFKVVSAHPNDMIQILFSSGTTGDPKAIPWDQTTPIKCASDAWLHHNIQPGDILCWPTNLGWMMGPWLIFAALLNKASLALYQDTPSYRGFGEFVQRAQVTMLGVVPTLVKQWRESGCMEDLDWRSIKAFSSTGECSNVEDMLYLMSLAEYRPIIEYCGGTEIGGGYITGTVIQPCAPAAFTTPALGLDFVIMDETGHPTAQGEVALIPPSIGLSATLINQDHHQVYYVDMPSLPDGTMLRRHGDQAKFYENGYYRLLGRIDDTLNLSGIKVSSVEIERILNRHPGVHETAAVGFSPQEGGPEKLIVFVVLAADVKQDKTVLKSELQQRIKEELNPLFKIQNIEILDRLPRTTSNKIMRRSLKDTIGFL